MCNIAMNYGKFVDNKLVYAPLKIQIDEMIVYNPNSDMLTHLGFKPLVYTVAPEAPDGYGYVSSWEETEENIRQIWNLEELVPLDPTAEEILEILK